MRAIATAVLDVRFDWCRNAFLRHVTGFEAFWYSHVLLLLAFPLAVFHGSRRPFNRYPTTSVSCSMN
jgi:hypothetical protein